METPLIDVRDQKGMALLRDLEALDIIRVLEQKQRQSRKRLSVLPVSYLPRRLRGLISTVNRAAP